MFNLKKNKIQVASESKTWELSCGKKVTGQYPPSSGQIQQGTIRATSFVKIDDPKILGLFDIAIIIKQNTYTHLHL